MALLTAVLAGGCDAGGPEEESDRQGLHVVGVDVTTRLVDETGAVTFVSTPIAGDGSTRPITGTSIRVRVDRFLDPVSASRQAICVQSSTAVIDSFEECSAGLILRPSYDPMTRTVSYFLETDTTRLAPDTLYRVSLFRSEGETGFGLRAFDGAPLGGLFAVELTTEADSAADPGVTEGPNLGINFCRKSDCLRGCAERTDAQACAATCTTGAQEVLDTCAYSGCHQATTEGGQAPMGLDMFSADGLQMTAIARVAHGTARGPAGQTPDVAGLAFGRAMAIIAPGDPGNSYLLYKVLANPAFSAGDPTLAPGESERLRSSFVVGAPMPPTFPGNAEPPRPASNAPMSPENAAILSQWIAAGADTSRCGPPPP